MCTYRQSEIWTDKSSTALKVSLKQCSSMIMNANPRQITSSRADVSALLVDAVILVYLVSTQEVIDYGGGEGLECRALLNLKVE